MGRKVRNKGIIRNLAGLGETVHPLSDFDVDIAIVDKWAEVVLVENRLGDERYRDHHVFIAIHVSVQVEVFDVHGHEHGVWGGQDAVEEEFGCGEAGGFGADITRVVNEVATDSPAHTSRLFFLGTVGDNIAKVGGSASLGDLVMADKVDSVGALGLFVALGKTASFFSAGFLPEDTVGAAE